jgi:hypothetical protein
MRARKTRKEEAPEGEADEVRPQHDRKRVRPRAEELDEQLRPHHLVAERHATRRGIEGERSADVPRPVGVLCHSWGVRRSRRQGRGASIEGQGGRGNRQAEGRRDEARARDAEGGHQHKRRREGPRDCAHGVRRVEKARCGSHRIGLRSLRAQESGQRATHEEGRQADERYGETEGKGPHRFLERDERRRRTSESEGGEDAKDGDAGLESRVETDRPLSPVGQPSQEHAAQREPREERGERDGHRVDLHAHDSSELLDPERLVGERDGARERQEERRGETLLAEPRCGRWHRLSPISGEPSGPWRASTRVQCSLRSRTEQSLPAGQTAAGAGPPNTGDEPLVNPAAMNYAFARAVAQGGQIRGMASRLLRR